MSPPLSITVTWDGRRVTAAGVAIKRLSGAGLLVGRSADEVLAWVPRLYSLCGKAQTAAARLALAAARNDGAVIDAATSRGLAAEQAQEHLWRLLRDWPPLFGVATRDADLAAWFRRLGNAEASVGDELIAYIEKTLLGMPVAQWMDMRELDDLAAWAEQSSSHVALLVAPLFRELRPQRVTHCLAPALQAADFAADAWDGDYAKFPVWCGAPAETGAYTRRCGHSLVQAAGAGLLGRLLARVVDLLEVARQIAQEESATPLADAAVVAENVGVARVDTARGMLLHRVELAGDKVASYAVVAPTEWNFHPHGAFVNAASSQVIDDIDILRRNLSCWVVAYDPCVEWNMELRRA